MRLPLRTCIALLAATFTIYGVGAQPQGEKPKSPDKKGIPKVKDPTQPSEKLKALFTKPDDAPPAIAIVARVIAKGKPGLAIIRVGDREMWVTKNSVIDWSKGTMTILDITADSLIVEIQASQSNTKKISVK